MNTAITLARNNFDLMRFVFACMVFLVHAYILSESEQLAIFNGALSSSLAVKAFFIVSGFLIFMSYENTRDIKKFFLKRFIRIYPAYFVVIATCTLLGAILSIYTFEQYFNLELIKYIFYNLLFLNFIQPTLPGLFTDNQIQAVNGALWTLKVEVMFYCFVPIAVLMFNKIGRFKIILGLYILSVSYSYVMLKMASQGSLYIELQRQLPGQLTYFLAGACCYYYFDIFIKYAKFLFLISCVLYMLRSYLPWLALEPIALAILVTFCAYVAPYLGNFAKYGDLSYGVYIIHFPIIQVLITFGLFADNAFLALGIAVILVIVSAFFSWHGIEKHFLHKSTRKLSLQRSD